ncbi:MAG TPA: hypothetical protein PLU52_11060 [Opitutaceae bacterium]|nr:hypothetical protein [Opitutaceae bacterium]
MPLDPGRPVLVHRTFGDEPGLWTLTQDGEVVGHADTLCLVDADFVFDRELQAQAKGRPSERTVYAWARGVLGAPQGDQETPIRFDGATGAFIGPGGPLAGCKWLSFRGKRVSGGGLAPA